MKLIRSFLLLLTALFFSGAANAVTIMPMGDSITEGIDFQTNAQGGYRDPLQTGLNSAGITFNFLGVSTSHATAALNSANNQFHNGYSGYRIDQLTANLDASDGQAANQGGFWITGGGGTGRGAQLPDILLLHIGGNDINQGYDPQTSGPSDAQFATDMGLRLTTLITKFHTLSPSTTILVAAIIPVNTNATTRTRTQLYNTYIQNTVVPSLTYTRFVNINADFTNADGTPKTGYQGTDNLHPTITGYQAMSVTWKNAIQAFLGGGGSAPAAPTALGATAGSAQVVLNWTASSGATSYNIYRGTAAGGESPTPIQSGVTATTYTNTGLVNGTTYYYKVRAVNANGASGDSNEANATPSAGGSAPGAPTALSATPGNAQVALSWTASSGATSYNVYRGTAAGGESTTPIITGLTATTYSNTGLSNGTAYYYKVAAVNGFGTSGYSNEAAATPSAGGGGSNAFLNPGFETPSTGNYIANPSGAGWTFVNNAGIQHNGSAYGATTAPEGLQTAFIQGLGSLGSMAQSVNFTAAGSYTMSFQAAQRFGQVQPILVTVDGSTVGTYTPASNSFASITTASFTVTAGNHNIIFAATDSTGDKSSFIDLVTIASGGGGGSAPAAPTGLGATAGNAQVVLSWTASSGATSYNVYRGTTAGGESTTAIQTGITGTSFTNTGLSNGTANYYKVAAVNATGTSGYSNEASATPTAGGSAPAAPTGLSATAGNAQIALSWTASSGATSYNIYRGTSAGGESTTAIQTGVTGTSYTNTGLTNGTAYYYKVAAVNSFGTSGYSNEANATPTAGGGGGSGTFANASFETPSTGNYIANPSGASWTFLNNSGIQHNGSAYGATTAPDGTQTAFLQGLGSLGSMSQSVNFSTAGSYTVSFLGAQRFGQIQPIQVSVDSTVVGTYTPASNSFASITTASFTVTAGNHTVTLAATDSAGDKSSFIDLVTIGSGSGGGGVPAAPTGLSATAGNAQVALSWTASSGATSYNVYRGTTAGGESTTPIVTGLTGTTYTNTGLSNGTAYFYKVAAVNATGTSAYSNEANATPAAGLAAPTGLTATAGNTQVALGWTASSGATSYNVYRGTTAGGESTTAIATGITGTTYTNTGLVNGTTYFYKVAAVNGSGTSAYSNEASATPAAGGGGSATFANASFEAPSIGGYTTSSTGTSWTFVNNAGIQHNGSAYSGTSVLAPDGTQTAFLQGSGSLGSMAQSVNFSAAGTYTISFQATRRYGTIQPVVISVDGNVVGTYSPASSSFASITTASFTVTSGSHTITFAATDSTGDKSTFIDSVSIQ